MQMQRQFFSKSQVFWKFLSSVSKTDSAIYPTYPAVIVNNESN